MVWMDTVYVSIHLLKDVGILASLSLFKISCCEHPCTRLHVDVWFLSLG